MGYVRRRVFYFVSVFLLSIFLLSIRPANAQPSGQLVVLVGPPGAGKTTQANILKKEFGMAVIYPDELIAQNRSAFAKYDEPGIHGVEPRLDPALNPLIEAKLRSLDLSKGVVLDGYPAAKDQGDFLAKLVPDLGLPRPIVIVLQVPDDVARKRLVAENATGIDQGLKDYHRELDFARVYFPQANIHDIDGTKSREDVAKEIRKVLQR